MTKKLLFALSMLLVASLAVMAADVTGKWTYEQQGRNGAQTITLDLKASGSTLTGTMLGPGRGGAAPMPMDISDGKVSGDTVTFSVKRSFNGNESVTKYEGTLSGADLKLKITAPGRGGGDPTTTEVTAKRATT